MSRRIFVDLEMNPIRKEYKEERALCRQEVIEIGAVCLNERNEEIDFFRCYVRPEYNPGIESSITELTGIETRKVVDADTFRTAFEKFLVWCRADYEIYSWSDSDPTQLQKEMTLKKIPPTSAAAYMFMYWTDLQKLYDDFVFLERQSRLTAAVSMAGLDFSGKAHNALDDARATAALFKEMAEGTALTKIHCDIKEARKPLATNLGALLNGLNLQTA